MLKALDEGLLANGLVAPTQSIPLWFIINDKGKNVPLQ